jgi:hypothetical protein
METRWVLRSVLLDCANNLAKYGAMIIDWTINEAQLPIYRIKAPIEMFDEMAKIGLIRLD